MSNNVIAFLSQVQYNDYIITNYEGGKNMVFTLGEHCILFQRVGEIGKISACGRNSIRFQATASGQLTEQNWTLIPQDVSARVWIEGEDAFLENGDMLVKMESCGKVSYYFRGKRILAEQPEMTFNLGFRNYENKGSNLWKIRVSFEAEEQEAFYGLGHERLNCFNKKGCTIDLRHVNTKTTVPYIYSSLGYGFIWNMPSTGTVELARNRTRWNSDCAKGIDYVVIGGRPADVTEILTDLTGHAPEMPEWALGFWQSKLRYENQEQVLEVARKYKEFGIPLSVIVIDYFHWTEQGDYKFDPVYWQDPKKMADELHEMGIHLMVSMWPTINEKSENYFEMLDRNMLIRTAHGNNRVFDFKGLQAEIDATNPNTRKYVWQRLKENYIDNGVDCMWFDEAEPEIHPEQFDNLVLYEGNGDEVALLYPYYYAKLVYDGMTGMGKNEVVTLSRSAYLGVQKYGTVVWSGDIISTFESLTEQVKSGLNMSMCGIPWWNTDIGGFYGGDIHSDYFRELIVRWFQYGVFCPVMRLHGSRDGADHTRNIIEPTGGDNEIWSFGEDNFQLLKELVLLRNRLIPYIKHHMDLASKHGTPVMRPMFYDYPEDAVCYETGDQYLFGSDIIFAPITVQGCTARKVYLPEGKWILTKDRTVFEGEKWYEIHAEIQEFIAFAKEGSTVLSCF